MSKLRPGQFGRLSDCTGGPCKPSGIPVAPIRSVRNWSRMARSDHIHFRVITMKRLIQRLFGGPLRTDEEDEEQIGLLSGVPVLGLDALASASYGPEAALTALLAVGITARADILPIIGAILALLILLFLSYHQTIAAYPGGGGSFTVARENLGTTMGQVAASALCVDYIVNSAVAISAGVGAIVSVAPGLLHYTVALC